MTCPRTVALGAYVLGALEREERAELEAHLETCLICREELDRLAPLPGLLSRLTVEEAEVLESADPAHEAKPSAAAASSAPLERALFEVARERRRSRRARAVGLVAAVMLAAIGVAAGLLIAGGDGGPPGPAPLTVSATDPRTGVYGSAELTREPWGTRVDLRLAGVRPGERCRLVARAAGGRAEVAANWRAGYLGTAEVPGAVAIPADRLVSLDIVTADERVLVRMPVMSR
jgi:Putative zinc-finger